MKSLLASHDFVSELQGQDTSGPRQQIGWNLEADLSLGSELDDRRKNS